MKISYGNAVSDPPEWLAQNSKQTKPRPDNNKTVGKAEISDVAEEYHMVKSESWPEGLMESTIGAEGVMFGVLSRLHKIYTHKSLEVYVYTGLFVQCPVYKV